MSTFTTPGGHYGSSTRCSSGCQHEPASAVEIIARINGHMLSGNSQPVCLNDTRSLNQLLLCRTSSGKRRERLCTTRLERHQSMIRHVYQMIIKTRPNAHSEYQHCRIAMANCCLEIQRIDTCQESEIQQVLNDAFRILTSILPTSAVYGIQQLHEQIKLIEDLHDYMPAAQLRRGHWNWLVATTLLHQQRTTDINERIDTLEKRVSKYGIYLQPRKEGEKIRIINNGVQWESAQSSRATMERVNWLLQDHD